MLATMDEVVKLSSDMTWSSLVFLVHILKQSVTLDSWTGFMDKAGEGKLWKVATYRNPREA